MQKKPKKNTHPYTDASKHTHMLARAHTHTHIRTYTHTHTLTNINTNSHTHASTHTQKDIHTYHKRAQATDAPHITIRLLIYSMKCLMFYSLKF